MADPIQIRAKEKRLADALRANLKRRKDQFRDRVTVDKPATPEVEQSPKQPPK